MAKKKGGKGYDLVVGPLVTPPNVQGGLGAQDPTGCAADQLYHTRDPLGLINNPGTKGGKDGSYHKVEGES